jgi:hypothetical protein
LSFGGVFAAAFEVLRRATFGAAAGLTAGELACFFAVAGDLRVFAAAA